MNWKCFKIINIVLDEIRFPFRVDECLAVVILVNYMQYKW